MLVSPYEYPSVVTVAQQAGSKIMAIYRRHFSVQYKQDNSPLTEADLAAHEHIVAALQALTPEVPVLSEEASQIPWQQRQHWQEYWLVDPLDGTKEFVKNNGEFTVNIAHIINGEPVWGVVVAPALDIVYHGGVAVSASVKISHGGEQSIRVAAPPSGKTGWRIMGSRSHQNDEFKTFVAKFNNPMIKNIGSSLKICLVAEGEADLYPRLGPTCEWDTAAAHAILKSAGGEIVNVKTQQPLHYNQQESLLNPHFMALANGGLHKGGF